MAVFYDKNKQRLSTGQALNKILNRFNNIFLDFELMLLRITGNIPSHTFRLFVYRLAGVKIGKGSAVHMWCNFFYPPGITIGTDSVIGDHCFLDGRDTLNIGSHVDIASGVLIYNSQHDIESPDFGAVYGPVVIGDYVFIGPRSIILPGVTIGKGAVIGAGAVVTRDMPPFSIAAGIPARVIGERKNKNPAYRLGRARLFQ